MQRNNIDTSVTTSDVGGWKIVAAAALLTVCGAYALTFSLNHDVAWWLHIARRLLDGEILYQTLIEVNPPLFGWVMIFPAKLSVILGTPPVATAKTVLLAILYGLILAVGVASERIWGKRTAIWLTLATGGVLLVPVGIDFGQREHLMVALLLPYLVVAASRPSETPIRPLYAVLIGILAAIGIGLKPHFSLGFIAVELVLIGRLRRSRFIANRPELISAVLVLGVMVVYLLLQQTYIRLLWSSRFLYESFSAVPRLSLIVTPYAVLLLCGVVALLLARRGEPRLRELALLLMVFSVANWISAVMQGKGWSYHFYPSMASATFAILIGLASGVGVLRAGNARHSKTSVVILTVLATLGLVMHGQLLAMHKAREGIRQSRREMLTDVVVQHGARSFMMFSPRVSDAFPLVTYVDLDWASPFPTLWWVSAAYGRAPSAPDWSVALPAVPRSGIEARFFNMTVCRFEQLRPDLVLVDRAPAARFRGRRFPYVEYFEQDSGFARVWAGYEQIGLAGGYAMFAPTRQELEGNHAP